jgi:hypothetical protein
MAVHDTQSQIQTIIAKTGSNMKPFEVMAILDALGRVNYTLAADGQAGAGESTLGTIFPSTAPNP